jgi:hypothetical protein
VFGCAGWKREKNDLSICETQKGRGQLMALKGGYLQDDLCREVVVWVWRERERRESNMGDKFLVVSSGQLDRP